MTKNPLVKWINSIKGHLLRPIRTVSPIKAITYYVLLIQTGSLIKEQALLKWTLSLYLVEINVFHKINITITLLD